MDEWAAEKVAEFKIDVPVSVPAGALSLAQRQLLEVVKALLARPEVLLLDEPTAALGPEEVAQLRALVFERSRAGVGIVYVSHRLPEVLGIADRITVLRDGVGQGTHEAAEMSEEALVTLMIGRPLQHAFPSDPGKARPSEALLQVSELRGERFGPVDLSVAEGEILGIAGAEGNGQVELLRALAGVERSTGSASCKGHALNTKSPLSALRADHAAERQSSRRVALPRSECPCQHDDSGPEQAGRLRVSQPPARAAHGRRHGAAPSHPAGVNRHPVQSLSGGNQQKVSLTRPFLRGDVKVILADEPTQGVDVGARFDIYEALREKTSEGVAVIVKSSDPLELAGLCDRVVVMSRREDRRGDSPRAARRTPDRRGDRRLQRRAGGRMSRFRGWIPLVLMTTLIVAVGTYTALSQPAFLTQYNIENLLLQTMPIALVSIGQTNALLVGGFDVSVAALMTLCVVTASYTMQPGSSWPLLLGGASRSSASAWRLASSTRR